MDSHSCAKSAQEWGAQPFFFVLLANPKKMASQALVVYAPVGRAKGIEVPAHPSMSTINVERVGRAMSPEKK